MNVRRMGRRGLMAVVMTAVMTAGTLLWTEVSQAGGNQPQPITVNIPSTLATISNATTTATTGLPFAIPPNQDLSFFISHSCANAGTSNTVYGFNFSPDGTLFTTAPPISLTATNNGTNIVTQSFVLNRTNFAGFAYGRFDSLSTTATNLLTVLAVKIGSQTP